MTLSRAKVSSATPSVQQLYQLACAARERAYSPYSGHRVGACIRTTDGRTYTGCNVENSSFGATVCAERVAIQKAISEQGKMEIAKILVVTDATPPWPPCGMCRQVIAEFAQPALTLYMTNLQGELQSITLGELFPLAFTPSHLSTQATPATPTK
jgi:cytidine deaminase